MNFDDIQIEETFTQAEEDYQEPDELDKWSQQGGDSNRPKDREDVLIDVESLQDLTRRLYETINNDDIDEVFDVKRLVKLIKVAAQDILDDFLALED